MANSFTFSLWLYLAFSVVRSSASLLAYAPSRTACPDISKYPLVHTFTITQQVLNPLERTYITDRESTIIPESWEAWLGNGSAIGYNTTDFTGYFARIGIAFSGGGYRASQFGAGVISAIDARNTTAVAAGTGGLLQVASYLSGLSGMHCSNFDGDASDL